MPEKPDEFDTAREIAKALQPFDDVSRQKILRWAKESLGMPAGEETDAAPLVLAQGGSSTQPPAVQASTAKDIRTFVAEKNPSSDKEFAAIDALEGQDAVDLLLTDVVMPDLPGPELAALLRERHPGLRELFMSGYLDQRLSIQGVLADGVHLIQKFFDGPALLERVRTVLASRNPGEVAALAAAPRGGHA